MLYTNIIIIEKMKNISGIKNNKSFKNIEFNIFF